MSAATSTAAAAPAPEFTMEHFNLLVKQMAAVTAKNPDAHLTTDDFTGHQKVKLYWSRTCSLYDFERNPSLKKWRVDQGQEHVFQRITGLHPETGEPIREGDLTKGVIMNMRLVRVTNNFPADFGVSVSDVHGMVATANGATYAFVAPKNEARVPANETFYLPKSTITRDLLAQYNDVNPEKLRLGTLVVPSNPVAAVDNKSVIADMIRRNAVPFGIDANVLPVKGQEGWFPIEKCVVEACFARYEQEQKVGFHDMRNFELTFTRVDSPKNFAEPKGICDNIARRNKTDLAHADNARLVNLYTISGEIEIELNLMGSGNPTEAQ